MKDYGFKRPTIEKSHYFGGVFSPVPRPLIRADGQWDRYLPKYEPQTLPDGEDTQGCPFWGTLNALEILVKANEGTEPNYSERYLFNVLEAVPVGDDPHRVAEGIRAFGLVGEGDMPMANNLVDFMMPRPVPEAFIRLGRQWLEDRTFQHEWAFIDGMDRSKREALFKEALKSSPLGISVTAWIEENGVYVDRGIPNNHWCVLYGWDKEGWKVFDSYDHSTKTVSFSHNIEFAKRYYAQRRLSRPQFIRLLEKLYKALKDNGYF